MEKKIITGETKECCKQDDNLLPYDEPTAPGDCDVVKCKVCGCRHFEVTMDTGKLGVHGVGMGGN